MRAAPHSPAPRLARVPRTGSTNDDLAVAAEAAPHEWPHLSALVADHQVAGHGRAGRAWHTPAGLALTVSFLLRPTVPPAALPAVTAVAGLAVTRAVGRFLPDGVRAATKWPNDVLLCRAAGGNGVADPAAVPDAHVEGWGTDRKVAGILARVVPAAGDGAAAPAPDPRAAHLGVVLGIGVNVAQRAADLPVDWATSLALAGAAATPAEVLAAVREELTGLLAAWEEAGGDLVRAACPSGAGSLHDALVAACATVGSPVRVCLAGGRHLEGTAVGLDTRGRLLLAPASAAAGRGALGGGAEGAAPVTVESGDVLHLRTFSPGAPDA